MKWPSHHVNTIRNQKVIPVWNSRQCEFSHVNTPFSSSAYLWMTFISENRVAGNNFFLHVLIWNVQLNNFNISQQLVLSKKSWIRLFRRGLHKVVAYFRPSLSHVWYGVGRVVCDWPVSERVFPACTTMSERMMKALLWFRHLLPFALIQPPVIHFTMPPKKEV